MALTDIERIRLTISDRQRLALRETAGLGDGQNRQFVVQLPPVVAGTDVAIVRAGGVETLLARDADYTIDIATGLIITTAAPAAGAEVVVTYKWAAFSDAELQEFLDLYGSWQRASIAAARSLIADTDRFMRYTFGQETVDRSTALRALQTVIEELRSDKSASAAGVVIATSPDQQKALDPFRDL